MRLMKYEAINIIRKLPGCFDSNKVILLQWGDCFAPCNIHKDWLQTQTVAETSQWAQVSGDCFWSPKKLQIMQLLLKAWMSIVQVGGHNNDNDYGRGVTYQHCLASL